MGTNGQEQAAQGPWEVYYWHLPSTSDVQRGADCASLPHDRMAGRVDHYAQHGLP